MSEPENTTPERVRPWYARREEWIERARKYVLAMWRLPPHAPAWTEVHRHRQLAAVRAIFESNQLEAAGLSEGETRKVVTEHFPELPASWGQGLGVGPDLADLLATAPERVAALIAELQARGIPPEDVRPTVRFRGKARPVREVGQHYEALLTLERLAPQVAHARFTFVFGSAMIRSADLREYLLASTETWSEDEAVMFRAVFANVLSGAITDPADLPRPDLLTEEAVRDLHRTLAEGLLPRDAGVGPGEYRIDARSVGLDVAFPAPELVPAAMAAWVRRTNELLYASGAPGALVRSAARISYDFVRIHPFPDFNGRMSRLLMNLVLSAARVPFPVVLRGGAKGKQRYLLALRRANHGDLGALEALIAMTMVEQFAEIDENLRLAGLPGLLDAPLPDDYPGTSS